MPARSAEAYGSDSPLVSIGTLQCQGDGARARHSMDALSTHTGAAAVFGEDHQALIMAARVQPRVEHGLALEAMLGALRVPLTLTSLVGP